MTRKTNSIPYRLLDHTADIRVEVMAATLEDLFVQAAAALTELLEFPDVESGELGTVSLCLEADRREDLLIDWLREILYRAQVVGFALERGAVALSEDASSGGAIEIRATIVGRFVSPDRRPQHEIKAVTYHGAIIETNADGYRAEFICDV